MAYYKCGTIHPTQNSNVVIDTASGSIANFETQLAMPLPKIQFNFKATQEAGTPTPQSPKAISGVSAVSVIHCHKNIFNYDESKITTGQTTIQASRAYLPLGFENCTLTFTAKLKDGATPISEFLNIGQLRQSDGLIETRTNFITTSEIYTKTVTFASGNQAVLVLSSARIDLIKSAFSKYDIQIEVGTAQSELEPFTGSTTLINLGGTYYGGYVSQDKDGKRELVVTHGVKLFSELDFRRSNSSGSWSSYVFFAQMSDKTNKSVVKCSNYDYVTQSIASMQNETITSGSSNEYIYIRDDNYTDVPTFKTANANTQLLYELAEPFTVALPDGEPIKSLAGINNIYADTGDTSLQFRKIG